MVSASPAATTYSSTNDAAMLMEPASSPSPRRIQNHNSVISVRTWMNRSTIYRRHEERMLRNHRLRGDTRPALFRVMSLLPGLDRIVPRYDPDHPLVEGTTTSNPNSKNVSSYSSSSSSSFGDYSEKTVFSSVSTTPSSSPLWKDYAYAYAYAPSNHQRTTGASQSAVQAAFATATTSALAHFLFGIPSASRPQTRTATAAAGAGGGAMSSNPFATTMSRSQQHLHHQHYHPTTVSSRAVYQHLFPTTAIPTSRTLPIVAAASSTAVLFGTKVYMEEELLEVLQQEESNSVVSSAAAGLVSGLVSRVWNSPTANAATAAAASVGTTATSLSRHLGYSMVGATLYFGIYDACCNQQTDATGPSTRSTTAAATATATTANPPHLLRVAGAGALAGTVYTAVVSSSSAAPVLWHSRVGTLLLRAAPTHALLWCSYETMRYYGSMTKMAATPTTGS